VIGIISSDEAILRLFYIQRGYLFNKFVSYLSFKRGCFALFVSCAKFIPEAGDIAAPAARPTDSSLAD